MITEGDLLEAIAECQGERNPNANTCIKLASYYTILDNITGRQEEYPQPSYSYSNAIEVIQYDGESDFAEKIRGQEPDKVWAVMDELMSTLMIIQPKLYQSVMREL